MTGKSMPLQPLSSMSVTHGNTDGPNGLRPGPRRSWYVAAIVASLGLSGCGLNQWVHNGFKVGPNYSKPSAPVASEWIDYQKSSHPDAPNVQVTSAPADLAYWWTAFKDPALNRLVQTAYSQNINLRVAGMRILEARYRRQIAVGELFPQLQNMTGSYSRNKVSSRGATPSPNLWFSNWDVGFNASWELDFWGRFRRAVEAADAELDASVENYDDVLVLLVAEVASSYVDMRTYQQRRVYAEQNVAAQENSWKIATAKFKNGVATQRDVEQALTVLNQTRALVPQFESGQRLANNRLCSLLGMPPRDMAATGLGEAPIPEAPPQVAIGIPADLIRRRPDVRRAEREVAAQSARIGIAASDLYPHISINGTFGYAAENFGDLFDGNRSTFGGIGPAFRWDVLNYGRITNNVRLQDARFQELAYAYQQRVLDAGQEAEDGIVTFLNSHRRSRHLEASAGAAERTVKITTGQYREGVVDFTAVFLAESELADRQDQAAEAKGDIAQSLIALYRALGGGWEMRLQAPGNGETGPAAPAPAAGNSGPRADMPEPNLPIAPPPPAPREPIPVP